MGPNIHVVSTKFGSSQQKSRLLRPINVFLLFCPKCDPVRFVTSASCSSLTRVASCKVFDCCSSSTLSYRELCIQRWSYGCCLSIIFPGQSGHPPLTSDITETFSPRHLLLTGYFLIFGPFSVNPRDGWVWNTQTSPYGTNKHPTFKDNETTFLFLLYLPKAVSFERFVNLWKSGTCTFIWILQVADEASSDQACSSTSILRLHQAEIWQIWWAGSSALGFLPCFSICFAVDTLFSCRIRQLKM